MWVGVKVKKWAHLRYPVITVPYLTRACANAQSIREYFRHKAHGQGYTLSHSQQRVIDCMAQQASLLTLAAQLQAQHQAIAQAAAEREGGVAEARRAAAGSAQGGAFRRLRTAATAR